MLILQTCLLLSATSPSSTVQSFATPSIFHVHTKFQPHFLAASTKITMPSSDDDFEPEKKKAKKSKKQVNEEDEDEEDEEETDAVKRNDDGEAYFEIGKAKRVTVRQWKKAVLVDIREFYEKGGKELPGKKGISLTLEQYKELKKRILDGSLDEQVKELEK